MKMLTVELAEDVYARAERRAAAHGITLTQQAAELLCEFATSHSEAHATASDGDVCRLFVAALEVGSRQDAASDGDVCRLFVALDKARNVKPVGSLRRDELYDRDVLR